DPNFATPEIYIISLHDALPIFVDVIIKSDDNRRQIKAKTDKSQTYEQLLSYLVQDHKELEEYITLQTEDNDIYIPKEEKSLPEKTVIAKKIKPEQFINA